MKRFCIAVLLLIAVAALAQDIRGAKDHPLFTRMPGYRITQYEDREFDAAPMPVAEQGKTSQTSVEGHVYRFLYQLQSGAPAASPVAVVRNYVNAAKSVGGETLFEHPSGRATLRIVKSGAEYWALVEAANNYYRLTIVEKQGMRQDVVANAATFARDLAASGKVAVYGIYFDTAKADLKPESDATIAEVAKLLKQNATLRLGVVGHTDMVGDAAANLKLSQARAQAVVNALAAKHGIPVSRLTSFGAGPYAPVASNKDENGRAKNRRVELVELTTR